jgi:chromosome segregation ATPase
MEYELGKKLEKIESLLTEIRDSLKRDEENDEDLEPMDEGLDEDLAEIDEQTQALEEGEEPEEDELGELELESADSGDPERLRQKQQQIPVQKAQQQVQQLMQQQPIPKVAGGISLPRSGDIGKSLPTLEDLENLPDDE